MRGFLGGSDGKESTHNVGNPGSSLGREDPLEKGMTTHSSVLAWRIPWTEEPGRLWPIAMQRVRHDRSDLARTHTLLNQTITDALKNFFILLEYR